MPIPDELMFDGWQNIPTDYHRYCINLWIEYRPTEPVPRCL